MWRTLTTALALTFLAACSSDDNGPETVGHSVSNVTTITAADVTAAIETAGLPVINPRDNTDQNCDSLPCVEKLTTDLYSVTVWDTPQDAKDTIDAALGDKPILVGDRTTIAFTAGGSTPTYDRAAYETAVATLNT